MPPVGHKREGQTEKYCSWREYQVIFFFSKEEEDMVNTS